ncbi:MAG TPA: T9SS type A sorting domain-containing protein, partial [Candidatus Marinimicrobia bacterium]|nr:T9SS type A sorting domain-containing protein [Candidatus Neomarinimicrobiota bacterium]
YNTNDILPVGPVGGNVIDQIWNSTNTSLNVTLTLPVDAAILKFDSLPGSSRIYDNQLGAATSHGYTDLQLTNSLTLEVWTKINSADTYDGLVAYGKAVGGAESGYGFVYFNGLWRFFLVTVVMGENAWQSNPATSIQNGVWTHLAGTYDGSVIKLYKDGVLVNSSDQTGIVDWTNVNDSDNLYVGKFLNDAAYNYFHGNVSEERVWNYARTQQQIAGFRSWTVDPAEEGLMAYLPMAGNLVDLTGNNTAVYGDYGDWAPDAPSALINRDFLEEIYDNTALVGAKVKLQASVNGGGYIDFGEDNIITLGDLPPNQMTVNTSADYLENIPGFSEYSTLTFGTKLIDISGNETIGSPSTDTLLVKQNLGPATNVSITSNNNNSGYAKTDDLVTVSFTTSEEVNTPTATIQGDNATVELINSDLNVYNATLLFTGDEVPGQVTFSVIYTDPFGNPDTVTAVTDDSGVIYDYSPPTILSVTTYSSNSYNTDYATIDQETGLGDTVFVRLDASERLDTLYDSWIPLIFEEDADTVISSNNDSTFTAYIVIDTDHPCAHILGAVGTTIDFDFTFMDFAGNLGTKIGYSSVKCDTTPPFPDTTGTVVPTGGTVANRFWNSTNTGLSVTIPIANDPTLIGGLAQPFVIFNNGADPGYWEGPEQQLSPPLDPSTFEIPQQNIEFTIDFTDTVFENTNDYVESFYVEFHSKIWDLAYNMTVLATGASILKIDTDAPTLEDKEIYSTNDDDARAILGDTVYVEFEGQYEGIDTVDATIGGQPIDGYEHLNDFSSRVWRKMTGAETEGILPFSITGGDTARNMSPIYTEVDTGMMRISVDFSAAGPEILFASIKSNSAYGDTLARPGDIISVEIRTDMPILLDSGAVIFGQIDTTQESPGNNQYLYSIEADTIDTVRIVQFSIDHTDLNGNEYDNINNSDITDTSYVRFDGRVPRFDEVSISSTGADPIVADSADTINLTFRIDEAVSDSSVTILNNPANSITPLGNNTFRASYTVTGSEQEGAVVFDISATDLAGNSASIDSTSDNSYVVFDQTPPSNFTVGQVISAGGDTVMPGYWNSTNESLLVTVPINNNDNSLINGAVQVLVSFDGSDTLEIGDAETITRIDTPKVITISDDDFEDSQHFAHGTTALFTARINDVAGYTTIGTASNDQLQIDQMLPYIDSIWVESNNDDSSMATYPDIVSVKFRAQEGLRMPYVIIAEDTAEYDDEDDRIWTFEKEMDSSDAQGIIGFYFTPMDSAGNTTAAPFTQTTDGSRVLYDYTAPFINYINEGSFEEDLYYVATADTLRLAIDGGDLLSGLSGFEFCIGTIQYPTETIDWTFTNGLVDTLVDNLTVGEGVILQNNTQYFTRAIAIDRAGNKSEEFFDSTGFWVDLDKPTKGYIKDGFDELYEADWTFDSTSLDVRWNEFKDTISQGVIGSYELSVFYEDTIEVLDWFTVDTLADSATITGLALQRNTEYFVKIRAVDMAGNKSDTAQTDGIQFDNQPARIDTVMPSLNSYLNVSSSQEIKFKFNKKLFSYKFSLDNIGADTIPYTDIRMNGDSTVSITLDTTLLTADTLYFKFDSVTSLNRLVMDETITLYSMLWGDLDSNHVLDVADVVRFNTLWPDIDLAPVEHEPPHYAPNLDGEANLRDLSIFSRMWNWYYKTYMPTMLMTSGNNVDLSATYNGGQLRIQLPENTSAGQIIFTDLNYDIINVSGASSSAQHFVLVNEDSVIGVKAYTFGSFGGALDSVFVINVNLNTETDYSQGLQVRFYDQEGKEILAGTALLKITPVPARYALGQNYPNPFNPTTTIRFELPVDAHTRIAIYDLLGREIIQLANKPLRAGYHQVVWQGRDTFGNAVPSGMYFYRMEANGFSSTRKMVFLK